MMPEALTLEAAAGFLKLSPDAVTRQAEAGIHSRAAGVIPVDRRTGAPTARASPRFG